MAVRTLLRLSLARCGGAWRRPASSLATGAVRGSGVARNPPVAARTVGVRRAPFRCFSAGATQHSTSPAGVTGSTMPDMAAFLENPAFNQKEEDYAYLRSADAFECGDSMEARLCAISHAAPSLVHARRMMLVYNVVPLLRRSTTARGHETSPLASLNVSLQDLWRVHVPMAMYLAEMNASRRRAARRQGRLSQALVVGVNAPPGCGKSTLVQILRFVYETMRPEAARSGRQVLAISQDDFYRTKADRDARGIPSRMAREGIDPDCAHLLHSLKFAYETPPPEPVQVPVFSKAKDDRVGYRTIDHGVELVLFEGWRVMVDNPELQPFNRHVDISVALTASLLNCRKWKLEQAARDAAAAGLPFDEQAWAHVWGHTILPLARDAVPRVGTSANIVVRKASDHSVRVLSRASKTHPCYGHIRVSPGGRKCAKNRRRRTCP